MTVDERMKAAETRIFKAVFPNTTNHYDTLFGGTAMHLMDEVAFITATRFSRQRMVTVSSDRIDFTRPIPAVLRVAILLVIAMSSINAVISSKIAKKPEAIFSI